MAKMSEHSGIERPALLAASVTVVLWASAFVSIRASVDHFSPGALALGRLLTGSVALLCVLLARRGGVPPRKAWPGIIASGVLWFGGYMVALNWGEQLVDAGTAAMVVNIGPIVIALLGGWLLKEGFPPLVLAGLGVSFVGAVVVGFSMSGEGSSSVLGVVLCLLAALTYGAGVVSQKPALRHATPMQVTTYGCLIGTAVCLPFSGQLVTQLSEAPLPATLNVVYLGLFPTALAFSTWAFALSRMTAGKTGATTYAVPAVVILISWLALDEVPGWLAFVGGAICLGGVAVTRLRPPAPRTPAAPPSEETESRGQAEATH